MNEMNTRTSLSLSLSLSNSRTQNLKNPVKESLRNEINQSHVS
jgi:hypothetical protein